ncbi:MAG: CamS family sex pheromone protein [Bacillaceae bacterium]|nr:CamS family sex pheromone protein [Bacillaceae bacterium]
MKKFFLALMAFLMILSGCAPSYNNEEEIVQETEEEQKVRVIAPNYTTSDEEYKVLLTENEGFDPGEARGVIVNQIANRLDIDELETGLMRHAKSVFDPEDYYFQSGQYVTEEMIYDWLERRLTDEQVEQYFKDYPNSRLTREELQDGLNPPLQDETDEQAHRDNPKYLSHILEQNYLLKTDGNKVELGGVAIGLALKSTYRFQTEQWGPYYYEQLSDEEILENGKQIAEKVLQRLRRIDALNDVPILIALYKQESHSSLVPGNFIAKTVVDPQNMMINEWERIDEHYVLFPSSEADTAYYEDANRMEEFTNEIAEFFPNYVGVVGKGFYADDQINQLKIDITIEFKGKAEVIGFAQYLYGLVIELFPNYMDIEVNVQSPFKQEILLVRRSGEEEPSVYIYN